MYTYAYMYVHMPICIYVHKWTHLPKQMNTQTDRLTRWTTCIPASMPCALM